MRSEIMYRLCPTTSFTLNNRWHAPVFPKKHVFFIPWDGGINPASPGEHNVHIRAWAHFLKFTKHRNPLHLFTVRVYYSRRQDRILKEWKGKELQEIMIPVDYMGDRQVLKMQTI